MLFTKAIDGVESWVDVYQSTKEFEPLVKEIFLRHHLSFPGIKNLTPGSNAVFLAGERVVKIFSPKEAGFSAGQVFSIEKAALRHANNTVSSPRLLCSGTIQDQYLFQYIIMDYIQGRSFLEMRKNCAKDQRRRFAATLKGMTDRMNIPIADPSIPVLSRKDCLENGRWNCFQQSFCEDRLSLIKAMSFADAVYVHGDLKAANVIIGENDRIHLIDFADSHIAPVGYEWPFIVFGLFGCDPEMMDAYFGDWNSSAFYMQLTSYLLMHKFGAFILMRICDATGTPMDAIMSVKSLYHLIAECIQNGNTLID